MLGKVELVGKVTLVELRKLSGMTQEQFAKFVNIPLTSYRRYEKDTNSMEVGKLVSICNKCGIGLEMIIP